MKWGVNVVEYWNARICLNGHIVDYGGHNTEPFCGKCGAEIISECQRCLAPIRGSTKQISMYVGDEVYYNDARSTDMLYPNYCVYCGNPYPWTSRIIESAVEALSFDKSIKEETKEIIRNAIPHLIVDTPDTPLEAAKFRSSFDKFNKLVKSTLYQLLVDVLSDSIRKTIFPDT